MKTLIAYYSLEGNTKLIAERLAKELNADTLRIEPIKDIPSEGKKRLIYGGFRVAFKVYPKLKPINKDLQSYNRIILGTPIWAGAPAVAVSSFLKIDGVKEKISAVFTSSGSGNNEKCIEQFKKILPNMKTTLSLISTALDKDGSNDEKLTEFIEKIK